MRSLKRLMKSDREVREICCVCCGEIIPEGRQVCPRCEKVPSGKKMKGET